MLLPEINEDLTEIRNEPAPSLGYKADFDRHRTRGLIDNFEATKQAVILLLATEQGEHRIYSADYGLQIMDLVGKPFHYAANELQRRIKETLLKDDRITAVHSFKSTHQDDELSMRFTVETIYGSFQGEKEVMI